MTATQIPEDDRLRVVVDISTGETVFGPAAKAQTAHWIIQVGFWRSSVQPLRVDVLPARSAHRREAAVPGRWERGSR